MINVLIADDEYHIREGIHATIPWIELEIQSVGTAVNGTDAWNQINRLTPDIVILDINMPEMDGLELAQRIRNEYKDMQIIFLTGYDDFDKAKKAIKLGVTDYLLKPVAYKELCHALEKAANHIKEKRSSQKYINNLKERVLEVKEFTVDKILIELLNKQRSYHETIQILTENGINFALHTAYTVISMEIDHYQNVIQLWSIEERKLHRYAFRKTAEEVIELFGSGVVLIEHVGKMTLIVNSGYSAGDQRGINVIVHVAEELQKKFLEFFHLSISIGVGDIREHPEQVPAAYQESIQALEYKAILGTKSIIYYGLIEPHAASEKQILNKELYLLSELRIGNESVIEDTLSKVIQQLKGRSISEAKIISTQLMIFAMRMIQEKELEEGSLEVRDSFSDIYKADTVSSVVEIVSNYFSSIVLFIKKQHYSGNPRVIEDAKQWIRDHISEDISLNKLANHLHMSPNYFSTLFKQATGETFIEFATRTRFDLAKQLLLKPEKKIYEIAEKVGYTDANYFSIAFKKSEGITPSQFRARYL